MHQVVLLNGPSKCGKDTIASHLVPYIRYRHLKFAAPLKRAVAGLLDKDLRWLEENKDVENRVLLSYGTRILAKKHTPRELLIDLSEQLLKPKYGEMFFGRIIAQEIRDSADQLVILSDGGFESEFFPVRDEAGRGNCRIIRIHRRGCDYSNDSRSYLPDGLCKSFDIQNDSTIHALTMRVLRVIVREFNPPLLREPDWIK